VKKRVIERNIKKIVNMGLMSRDETIKNNIKSTTLWNRRL